MSGCALGMPWGLRSMFDLVLITPLFNKKSVGFPLDPQLQGNKSSLENRFATVNKDTLMAASLEQAEQWHPRADSSSCAMSSFSKEILLAPAKLCTESLI